MLTVDEFLTTEGFEGEGIKEILANIQNLQNENIKQHTDSYNVYDLDLDFVKNYVTITENLLEETDMIIKLDLSDFIDELLTLLKEKYSQ